MLLNVENPQKLPSMIILPMLHRSFLEADLDFQEGDDTMDYPNLPPVSTTVPYLTASQSLVKLLIILTNTDPSPHLLSTLLSPILPALYNALFCLDDKKTSDPRAKESLRGVLETWGRIVTFDEAVSGLWSIINNEGGEWEVNIAGELMRVGR